MKKPNKWRELLRRPEDQTNNRQQWVERQQSYQVMPQGTPAGNVTQQGTPVGGVTQQGIPVSSQPQVQRPQQRPPAGTLPPYAPPGTPPLYPPGMGRPPFQPDRRCYPFDAYGLEGCTPQVNMNNPEVGIEIPLLINVTIPTGFVLPTGVSYESYLSVDRSQVTPGYFTQYFVCTTLNDPVNPNPQMIKSLVVRLSGPMYYNLTLSGFMPQEPVTDTAATPITSFNEAGYLDIEYILAYLQPTDPMKVPGYTIEARLINTSVEGDLQDPSTQKALIFNFVIKIQVVPPQPEIPNMPAPDAPATQPSVPYPEVQTPTTMPLPYPEVQTPPVTQQNVPYPEVQTPPVTQQNVPYPEVQTPPTTQNVPYPNTPSGGTNQTTNQ